MTANSLFGQTTADTVICEKWAQIFSLSDSLIEGGTAIDAMGNIYVAGISKIDGATGGDILLLKYNKTGQLLWNVIYTDPYNDPTKPLPKMLTDTQGNVLIGYDKGILIPGIEGAPDTRTTDFAVLKYDSSGIQQWVASYDGGNEDNMMAMAMDESGNVFAAGSSKDALGNQQVKTVKFNANGSPQWTATLNTPTILSSVAKSIAIKNENIYVGGQCTTPTGITRYILIKYNSLGVQQWIQQYSNGSNAAGEKIAIDGNENISILGHVTLPT